MRENAFEFFRIERRLESQVLKPLTTNFFRIFSNKHHKTIFTREQRKKEKCLLLRQAQQHQACLLLFLNKSFQGRKVGRKSEKNGTRIERERRTTDIEALPPEDSDKKTVGIDFGYVPCNTTSLTSTFTMHSISTQIEKCSCRVRVWCWQGCCRSEELR